MAYHRPVQLKKVNDIDFPQKINELIFKIIDCINHNITNEKINARIDAQMDADMGDGRFFSKSSKSDKKNEKNNEVYLQELGKWLSTLPENEFFDKLQRIEKRLGYKKYTLMTYCNVKYKLPKEDINMNHMNHMNDMNNKKEEENENKEEEKKPYLPPRPPNPRHY